MADVRDVNEQNWETEVLTSDVPVLVDFWATWCGPCKALGPTVEAISQELSGRLKVVKLNTEEAGGLAVKYEVRSIPVLMLFKDGKVVHQIVGNQPKPRILQQLEPHL
jgi:thioredoxin 1